MTSLKGPFSEQGDTSPDLDVRTGPPAEEAVAAEVAREAPEPQPVLQPEPPPEPAPIDEHAPAEAPPPAAPTDADEPAPVLHAPDDLATLPAPTDAFDSSKDIPTPEQAAESAPDTQVPIDAVASEELDSAPGPDLPVEPAAAPAETSDDPEEFVAAPAIAQELSAEPTLWEPTPPPATQTPPPLPIGPAPPPPAPLPAPAIASAITAPAAVALDPPTQPMAAPPPPPPIAIPTVKPTRAPWRVWLRRTFIALVGLATGYATLIVALIGVYRFVDPPRSTVMLGLNLSGQSVDYEPVPITSISSYLQRAVVTSEDARFCRHGGVDWGALAEAMQDSRGGSTITMQTAKNLFLWPSRSYVRKAIEIPVALMIDFAWPKRRILEVYLNIAEWGPGVFGAEAAAQYHFGKPASRLTQHEATLLAASLPNPIAREAGDPGRITELLASRLRGRMANSDVYVSCLGLRPMPRAEPAPKQRPSPTAATKPAPKPSPWQTRTEPAKPPTPFNPWQN